MEIILEDYKIIVDRHCWELYQKRVVKKDNKNVKKGDIRWVESGYFTNLETMTNKILRLDMENDRKSIDMYEFLQRAQELINEMSDLVGTVRT
jgi:hypothetical protein